MGGYEDAVAVRMGRPIPGAEVSRHVWDEFVPLSFSHRLFRRFLRPAARPAATRKPCRPVVVAAVEQVPAPPQHASTVARALGTHHAPPPQHMPLDRSPARPGRSAAASAGIERVVVPVGRTTPRHYHAFVKQPRERIRRVAPTSVVRPGPASPTSPMS